MKCYSRKPSPRSDISFSRRNSARLHRSRIKWVLLLFMLIVATLIAGILTHLLSPHSLSSHTQPSAYVSPYHWEGLQKNGDRLAYYEGQKLKSEIGIDVSSHQGPIDWNTVASDGISFAMVRAGNRGYTEGSISSDSYFIDNLNGASQAGLKTGVYFFSQAITADEAREEAQFVIKQLGNRTVDLPIAFDHEPVEDSSGRANSIQGAALLSCEKAFCDTIAEAGYDCMVYGNKQDIARYGHDSLGTRQVWLAEYGVNIPTAQFDFTMWQYKSDAKVAGIICPVDLNLHFIAN